VHDYLTRWNHDGTIEKNHYALVCAMPRIARVGCCLRGSAGKSAVQWTLRAYSGPSIRSNNAPWYDAENVRWRP